MSQAEWGQSLGEWGKYGKYTNTSNYYLLSFLGNMDTFQWAERSEASQWVNLQQVYRAAKWRAPSRTMAFPRKTLLQEVTWPKNVSRHLLEHSTALAFSRQTQTQRPFTQTTFDENSSFLGGMLCLRSEACTWSGRTGSGGLVDFNRGGIFLGRIRGVHQKRFSSGEERVFKG